MEIGQIGALIEDGHWPQMTAADANQLFFWREKKKTNEKKAI